MRMAVASLVVLNSSVFALESRVNKQDVSQQVTSVVWHSLIDDMTWRYTIETQLDTGRDKLQQRIQRYSPDLAAKEQWQLIEHQYQPPTPQMLYEYQKTMANIMVEPAKVDITHSQIVNIDTLAFDRQSAEHSEFTFRPTLPMFEKDDEANFLGRLFVSKQSGKLDYLTISLKGSFKPSFTTTLDRYDLKIAFSIALGFIHVSKIESHKQGKLMYVSAFNEKSIRLISDIQPISNY